MWVCVFSFWLYMFLRNSWERGVTSNSLALIFWAWGGGGSGLHQPIQRPYTRRTSGVRFRAEVKTALFTTNTDRILKVADPCLMVAADKFDRSLRLTTDRHLGLV